MHKYPSWTAIRDGVVLHPGKIVVSALAKNEPLSRPIRSADVRACPCGEVAPWLGALASTRVTCDLGDETCRANGLSAVLSKA